MALCLAADPAWLAPLSKRCAAQMASPQLSVRRLAALIAADPDFEPSPPRHYLLSVADEQALPPPALAQCALPALPHSAALAEFLGISDAGLWRLTRPSEWQRREPLAEQHYLAPPAAVAGPAVLMPDHQDPDAGAKIAIDKDLGNDAQRKTATPMPGRCAKTRLLRDNVGCTLELIEKTLSHGDARLSSIEVQGIGDILLGPDMQGAAHSRLLQLCPQPCDGFGCRNFSGETRCQLSLTPISLQSPGGFCCGVSIEAGDQALKKMRDPGRGQFQGRGFKGFKMAAHDVLQVGNAAGWLSLPQTASHQNSQRPLITTQTPSAPLVTACAITAVHSLPVRT